MCHAQILRLDGNDIGDAGLTALAKAVESGALAQLTRLDLDTNRIGDAGLTALAEAIKPAADNASGALDKLTVRWCPTALSPCPETWHMHSLSFVCLFVCLSFLCDSVSCRNDASPPSKQARPREYRAKAGVVSVDSC